VIVGRSEEQALLAGVLDDARASRARRVAIVGEAGIGKSALLDELAGKASDFMVLRVLGVESESGGAVWRATGARAPVG
jgi:predicted ABC-type transport system involved in lysophospholipase L1 biosynthesis ATPase subunit